MDRIDIRLPVEPVEPEILLTESPEDSQSLKIRIEEAAERQKHRYKGLDMSQNRALKGELITRFCHLEPEVEGYFTLMARKLNFSSRACHSILKVARTIADLRGDEHIGREALEEAGQYRRFGDSDFFWENSRRF